MSYLELRKINVNEHTEKKGKFTYLSWAWAVDQLLQQDPQATWTYGCLLYTSPSPRDRTRSRMPSSA